ncbi:MAG TPA: hypothetical protein VIF62_23090 [Labilithrix sp.]|jgi:hypothetical protein
MRLVPCESCARHVRVDAERCPFCDASLGVPCEMRAPRRGLSRAAVYAAIVTTAACRKDAVRADVAADAEASDVATPLVVDASPAVDMTPADAAQDAAPDASVPAPRPGKRVGASCTANGECAAGLACCVTGYCPRMRPGRFGDPDVDPLGNPNTRPSLPPCTPPRTCAVAPCRPLPALPYGCVFPDACSGALV